MSLITALARIGKFLGTRNVRVPGGFNPRTGKMMPKGTGITRRGQTKTLKGGQRILKKSGGGTTFIKGSAKLGMTRGQKGAAYGAGGAAIIAGATYKPPSGPPTAGQKQMNAVGKVPKWHGDVAKFSPSGYHTFKKGSQSAKRFQKSYALAKKTGAKEFTWGLTGKKYKVSP